MSGAADLVFECSTCGCHWLRSYVTNADGSLATPASQFSLVAGHTAKSCCDNAKDVEAFYKKIRLVVTGEVDARVHAGEPRYGDARPIGWNSDGTCSYCGSLSVPDAVRLLKTPGSQFSGTDKTGYKSYIGDHRKFYFSHLRACTEAELLEFDALSRKVFGIRWGRAPAGDPREGELIYWAPRSGGFYGWQTWGHIGEDGEPVFHDGSPRAPGPEFWT